MSGYLSEVRRAAALRGVAMRGPDYGEKIRQGRLRHFAEQIDPEGIMPEAERERRALALQDAHCARMRAARAKRGDAGAPGTTASAAHRAAPSVTSSTCWKPGQDLR